MDPSSGQPQQMSSQSVEKKPKPHPEQALKCPRCDSTSTKFCYYNNYSLSQPRYFCKSCRRYWTKGGTLRNVPVGGGCRKKRSSSSSLKRVQDQTFTPNLNPLTTLPHLSYDSNDFTLALARFQKQSIRQLGYNDHDLSTLGNPITGSFCDILGNSGMTPSSANPLFLDAIRTGFLETQNHLQNLYCMYGNGDLGEVDNSNSGVAGFSGEMMLPYDQVIMSNATTQSVSVTKQEMCSGREQSERRVLGGFPWQINADTNIGELDSGRAIATWNSFTNSWHELLQSPLM